VVSPRLARTKGARGPADCIRSLFRKWGQAILISLCPHSGPRADGNISNGFFAMNKAGNDDKIPVVTLLAWKTDNLQTSDVALILCSFQLSAEEAGNVLGGFGCSRYAPFKMPCCWVYSFWFHSSETKLNADFKRCNGDRKSWPKFFSAELFKADFLI
jgi:hypothetical protein